MVELWQLENDCSQTTVAFGWQLGHYHLGDIIICMLETSPAEKCSRRTEGIEEGA